MKKSVEIAMFDKNDNKVSIKTLNTKTVKCLAGIKRIDELEYDCDAIVRLNAAIVDAINHCTLMDISYIVIFNDYSETVDKINID